MGKELTILLTKPAVVNNTHLQDSKGIELTLVLQRTE